MFEERISEKTVSLNYWEVATESHKSEEKEKIRNLLDKKKKELDHLSLVGVLILQMN